MINKCNSYDAIEKCKCEKIYLCVIVISPVPV